MTDHRWKPITLGELKAIIRDELERCPPELVGVFEEYAIEPTRAPIDRYGGDTDFVFIAARKGNEVLYYNDIEHGWNFSAVSNDGKVLEHWCDQKELSEALWKWEKKSVPGAEPGLGDGGGDKPSAVNE